MSNLTHLGALSAIRTPSGMAGTWSGVAVFDIETQILALVFLAIALCGRVYKPGPYRRKRTGQNLPQKPGAYRARNRKTGKVDYHGETNNLQRRHGEHKRAGAKHANSKTHDLEYKVADGRSTSKTRREHENRKINQHRPKYNKRKGGGGRKGKGGSGRRKKGGGGK